MDCKLIDILASRDPRSQRLPSVAGSFGMPMDIQAKAEARFRSRYSNVAFGWYIAMSFADAGVPFPVTSVASGDHWLFRAYMMRLDSARWECDEISDAWAIANLPAARSLKSKICGMLLSGCGRPGDIHRREVSEASGIPLRTIEAFDTLFYNVLDRCSEQAFMSEQVYPHSRMVEFREDYMQNADVSDLLKRAGYNHRDLELATFLAGIGDQSYMAKLASKDDREQELTRQLMGNALLLVSAGALNQKAVGLSRSLHLLASSRQSGSVVDVPPVADSGASIADELRAAMSAHDANRLQLMREDAGEVSVEVQLPDT